MGIQGRKGGEKGRNLDLGSVSKETWIGTPDSARIYPISPSSTIAFYIPLRSLPPWSTHLTFSSLPPTTKRTLLPRPCALNNVLEHHIKLWLSFPGFIDIPAQL
jgi:hypothetical protein